MLNRLTFWKPRTIDKGETNSKWFFKPTFLPKNKQTNSTLLLVDLFMFVFGKKMKTPKRHFEINWPLAHPSLGQKFSFLSSFSSFPKRSSYKSTNDTMQDYDKFAILDLGAQKVGTYLQTPLLLPEFFLIGPRKVYWSNKTELQVKWITNQKR